MRKSLVGSRGVNGVFFLDKRASMAYMSFVSRNLITVAETPLFTRQADDVWKDEEREAFVNFIAGNPGAGDVIPETGGVRKVRWARAGTGKRGGARVILLLSRWQPPFVFADGLREGAAGRPYAGRKAGGAQACRHPEKRERTCMMGKFAKELIESMEQAATHARGRKVPGIRVSKVEIPDVKAIRRSLKMSQDSFSVAFRIPLPTLKNWEQGRRHPDAPAAAYPLAIKRRPKEVMEAVS
jgi:putative transcriptional regulator